MKNFDSSNSGVFSVFATNIFHFDFKESEIIEELKYWQTLEKYTDHFEEGHALSGLDMRVLEKSPKLKSTFLDIFVNQICQTALMLNYDFDISTSWFTKTSLDQSSGIHNHKHAYYSGIYYFGDYSDQSAKIEFYTPTPNLPDYSLLSFEYNILNSKSWHITPYTGLLLFFPSHIYHKIKMHKSDIERHSLAFNIVPVGQYGNDDGTYNTAWFS